MQSARHTVVALSLSFAACFHAGCGGEVTTLRGCRAEAGITPICGFQNPEDIVQLAGTSWLVISQLSRSDGSAGSLLAFRVSDQRRRSLYPVRAERPVAASTVRSSHLGSADCPGQPDPEIFAPHGIDVALHSEVGALLAAVNHGGRESIEFFGIGRDEAGPTLEWRGCVVLPDDVWPNDVALLGDGGVLVSNMLPGLDGRLSSLVAGVRVMFGRDTGSLLEWHPGQAWREVPESSGSAPNGVAVSSDGSEIYFTEWGGNRLVRLRRDGAGDARESVALPHHPDNISWTRDGQLLVAGQMGGVGEILACSGVVGGTCAIGYSIVRVDPISLEAELVLEGRGAASVALEVGDELYIGTFAGDRVVRASYRR